jgi:hypothetical protein
MQDFLDLSYSESEKNAIQTKHDMRLKQMETFVKSEMSSLDTKLKEHKDQIEIERERMKTLQDIITKYILKETQKIQPSKSRVTRNPRSTARRK